MTDSILATREDGATLAIDLDIAGEALYVATGFSPGLIPTIRTNDQDTLAGETGALDVDGGRPMTINVASKAWPDLATVADDLEAFDAFWATGGSDVFLQWTRAGVTRGRYVRPRGVNDTTDTTDQFGQEVQLAVRALDPRSYGPAVTATVTADLASVNVGGRRPTAAWLFTAPGPLGLPVLRITLPSGDIFTVELPAQAAGVAAGERLEIDARNDEIRAVNTTTGIPRWNLTATDGAGRAATLWPIGPGEVPCTFADADHPDTTGTLTAMAAF